MVATVTPGQSAPAITTTTSSSTPTSTTASTQTVTPTGVSATTTTIQSADNTTNTSSSAGCCTSIKNFFQSILDRVWGAFKGFTNWVKSFFVAAETTTTPVSNPTVLTQVEGLRNYIALETTTLENARQFLSQIPQSDQEQIRARMTQIAVANADHADAINGDANWATRVIRGTEDDGSALPANRADIQAHVQILAANSSFRQAVNDVIAAQALVAQQAAAAAATAAQQQAASTTTTSQTIVETTVSQPVQNQ